MVIPTSKEIRLPLLEFLAKDRKDHRLKECVDAMGKKFHLSQSEMDQLYKKRNTKRSRKRFYIRVANTVTSFKKGKSIEHTKRGVFHITNKGLNLLNILRGSRN